MTARWRLAIPLTFLVTIHLATLFGDFLAPNSPIKQSRDFPWAPPTKLRFMDADGEFHLRPFVYPLLVSATGEYVEEASKPYPLRFLVRGDSYLLLGVFRTDLHLLGVEPPANLNLLGTDEVGRDVFARLLLGGRVSLFAGVLAAAIALTFGAFLGATAGYFGGHVDAVLMLAVDLFLSLPWLYLLLALRAFLSLDHSPTETFFLLVLAIGCIGWAQPARLVRGITASATERQFVTASIAVGASHPRILCRHVLPQCLSTIVTQAAILIPTYMLAEVTLSFLGLGIAPPAPTWGSLLRQLQSYHVFVSYRWMLAPLFALLTVLLSYHSLHLIAQTNKPAQRLS